MRPWELISIIVLICGGALYIRLRWRRSPQAYRAMIGLAGCYFVAGSLAGVSLSAILVPKPTTLGGVSLRAVPSNLKPVPEAAVSLAAFDIGSLHYEPAHAVLPDPKLTPGDVFTGAGASDVCTPGWAGEHRRVTEEMRDQVYEEYQRTRGPDCCEVDHLIPLELGGSNDIKNLWPEPDDPRPGSADKDQLENELHRLVCAGDVSLTDAQRCIASNWVECWEKYMVPIYGRAAAR